MGRWLYIVSLALALGILWITLSGRTHDQLTLTLGAVSIVVVVMITSRMGVIDGEGTAYYRIGSLLAYWVWLIGEIVKANIEVARAVLRADLDVTPRLFRVRAAQKTDLGRTIFANSITLTPGTVTVDIDGDDFIVHALLDSMSDPAGFEEMNRRAAASVEGGRA